MLKVHVSGWLLVIGEGNGGDGEGGGGDGGGEGGGGDALPAGGETVMAIFCPAPQWPGTSQIK